MKKLSKAQKTVLYTTVTALVYSAVKGNGIFNKPRFFNQYRAIKKYIDTTYPGAVMGNIVKTSGGWASVINCQGEKILLNVTKTSDGNYIFSEEKM